MKYMQRSSLTPALVVCLTAIPAGFIGLLILQYGVDVPYMDQWDIAPFFERLSHGSLTLRDLFAQQNEFRQFFPYLIFLAVGRLTRWNVKYEMLVILLLACLVSLNVYRLSETTLGGSRRRKLLALFIVNLLIFSPVQHENWLFGIQVVYFMPVACLTTCLLVAYSALRARTRFLICMCLSTISTFSSANGMLCWALALPVLARAKSWDEPAGRKRLIAAWITGWALNAALYFYDYQKPAHHPSLSAALVHPVKAVIFFLSVLGAPLGFSQVYVAPVVGTALIILFSLAGLYLLRFFSDELVARRMIGWVMLGSYSVITAAMITVGRFGFGPGQSVISRYTTFTVYLIVALVHLIPIIIDDSSRRDRFMVARSLLVRLVPSMVAILAGLHLLFSAIALRQVIGWRQRLLQAKACLLFIDLFPEGCAAHSLYIDQRSLRDRAVALDRLGFLRPGLIKSSSVEDLEAAGGQPPSSYGSFEALVSTGDGMYVASGWALLPDRGEPADAVLLAYDDSQNSATVFALAEVEPVAGLLTKVFKGAARSALRTRWQRSLAPGELPPGRPLKVTAWAFDAETGKAFRLDGAHVIQRPD